MTLTPPNTRSGNNKKISNLSNPSDEKANLLQIINTNKCLMVQNAEILKKITDVENAIQFLSNKYDELKLMYEKVITENASLKNNNTLISSKLDEIQNDNNNMHCTINEIKQNEFKKNMVIFGVPCLKDQRSLELTFENILAQLQIPKTDVKIDDIFQKKANTEQSPVFVKFTSLQQKIDFKQAAKASMQSNKRYLHACDIGFTSNNKIIFVDQLTDINRNLLREAKQLRAHGYKYIWTVNGRILVKKNEDADVLVIKTLNCIESLKIHNTTI